MSKSHKGENVQVEDVEATAEGHDTAGYAGAEQGVILERLPEMLSPRQRLALAEIGKGVSIGGVLHEAYPAPGATWPGLFTTEARRARGGASVVIRE